jgi:hypothetical protein
MGTKIRRLDTLTFEELLQLEAAYSKQMKYLEKGGRVGSEEYVHLRGCQQSVQLFLFNEEGLDHLGGSHARNCS